MLAALPSQVAQVAEVPDPLPRQHLEGQACGSRPPARNPGTRERCRSRPRPDLGEPPPHRARLRIDLEPQAAAYLEDKVLDAPIDSEGQAHFSLRASPARPTLSSARPTCAAGPGHRAVVRAARAVIIKAAESRETQAVRSRGAGSSVTSDPGAAGER